MLEGISIKNSIKDFIEFVFFDVLLQSDNVWLELLKIFFVHVSSSFLSRKKYCHDK